MDADYPEFENEDDPTQNLYIKLNADGSIPEALKGFYKIELSGSGSFESSCVDVGVFDVISVIPEIIGTPPETVCGGDKIEVSINGAENRGYIWEKIVGDKSYFYAEGEKIVIQPAPEDEERTETFRVTTIQTNVEQENCRGGFVNISVIVKKTPSMKLE